MLQNAREFFTVSQIKDNWKAQDNVDSYYIDNYQENKKYDEYIMEITILQTLIEKKEKELFGIISEDCSKVSQKKELHTENCHNARSCC